MGWLVDRTAEFHARGERGSDLASVLGGVSARAEIVTTARLGWLGVGRVRIFVVCSDVVPDEDGRGPCPRWRLAHSGSGEPSGEVEARDGASVPASFEHEESKLLCA
jgi:hypothetical protein